VELLHTDGPQARFARIMVEGMSAALAGDSARAHERLSEAFELGKGFTEGRLQVLNSFVGAMMADWPGSRRVSEQALALGRARGSLPSLMGAFPLLALGQRGEGRLAAATSTIEEGLELAERLGFDNDATGLLALKARIAAQRGNEDECRALVETAMRRSLATGVGWATEEARMASAELELGLGNAHEALEHFDQVTRCPLPPVRLLAAGDIIDAALRIGDRDRAHRELEELEAWAPISSAPLVTGLLARCRALLAEDPDEAERQFERSLAQFALEAPVFERARTQLAYGERLRRERRKVEARTQLRTALDTFEGMGARLWAERARGELGASGETARKRDVSTLDDLTPQELRIAQLVAAGATNRDAAAQLFVSPKTVEYHLRKVFMKLGVGSRVELARVPLGEPPAETVEGPN
jgi:DNA-binding CsgD family transcriptional regulator